MSEPVPSAELLHALGRLARGLSALFWGLPIALLICVQTVKSNFSESTGLTGMLLPVFSTGLLYYGLMQLGHFQKQERVWMTALERTKFLALINVGLSPFLYWYHHMPEVTLYAGAVGVLALSGTLFLFNLNDVLNRLAAMLPDESVRLETRYFTRMNRHVLLGILLFLNVLMWLDLVPNLPLNVYLVLRVIETISPWFFLFLFLLPLAMTMTLLWKVKEVILASVFGPGKS